MRADLLDRPGVRRSAGRASRHGAEREEEGRRDACMWSASRSRCRAPEPDRSAAAGAWASTPTRCSRNSASAPRKSPRCARPRRFDEAPSFRDASRSARGVGMQTETRRLAHVAARTTPHQGRCQSEAATDAADRQDAVAQGGRVGYLIFNNPERHNAVSLDMWQAAAEHARRLPERRATSASWWSPAPAARRSSRAPTSRASRRSAPTRRRWRATTTSSSKSYRGVPRVPRSRPSR